MNTIKTVILVIALLAIGYVLLPYVKINPKTNNSQNNQNQNNQQTPSHIQTFKSDNLGISFQYNDDQDNNGAADTSATESGTKAYVYYTAGGQESGQWVEKFTKDPSDSLTVAIQKQFLKNYSSKDCYPLTLQDYYKSFDVAEPALPTGISEAVIAYPPATDPNAPFWQNADKCPQVYSATNGISYFYMDQAHPDRYYFFSIGQYAIFSDTSGKQTWQNTFQVK